MNTNNKVNRWGIELVTYSITFKWISGAWNKAAYCLSRLVKLPTNSKATIKMLTATNSDGVPFNTRSKTSHQCQTLMDTELSDTHSIKETVTPDLGTVETTQNITPKPLTADRHEALLQMQKMDPFCKCISRQLSNGKSQQDEEDLFYSCKGMSIRNLWHSSYQKLGSIEY